MSKLLKVGDEVVWESKFGELNATIIELDDDSSKYIDDRPYRIEVSSGTCWVSRGMIRPLTKLDKALK